MKKTLLSAATAVALTLATPLAAHDNHDCLDASCTIQSLFQTGDTTTGGDAGDVVAAKRLGTWGIDTAGMDTSV
ncbi:hypothetical protein [Luteimonas cellulosilyticus]|nr:hypothetical protein [Luteimonas cellulosilyticus]